jgi:excisionase family DNA binding protein
VDSGRLDAVLGATPRYLAVAEAARASGFSARAVYRAIERGELSASVVCSRLRIHPDDFLAWMEGERAAMRYRPRGGNVPNVPPPNGLRDLLAERGSAA